MQKHTYAFIYPLLYPCPDILQEIEELKKTECNRKFEKKSLSAFYKCETERFY